MREKVEKISLPFEGKSRGFSQFPSEGKSREITEFFPGKEKVYILRIYNTVCFPTVNGGK